MKCICHYKPLGTMILNSCMHVYLIHKHLKFFKISVYLLKHYASFYSNLPPLLGSSTPKNSSPFMQKNVNLHQFGCTDLQGCIQSQFSPIHKGESRSNPHMDCMGWGPIHINSDKCKLNWQLLL